MKVKVIYGVLVNRKEDLTLDGHYKLFLWCGILVFDSSILLSDASHEGIGNITPMIYTCICLEVIFIIADHTFDLFDKMFPKKYLDIFAYLDQNCLYTLKFNCLEWNKYLETLFGVKQSTVLYETIWGGKHQWNTKKHQ